MNLTIADVQKLWELQQHLSPNVYVRKSEPAVLDEAALYQRAFEISRLGLMLMRQGIPLTQKVPENRQKLETFKNMVRESVPNKSQIPAFLEALRLNVFMDGENPEYRQALLGIVYTALDQ